MIHLMPNSTASVVVAFRINPRALDVLEYHARLTGVPLRSWIREGVEEVAAQISEQFDMPDEIPPPPEPGWLVPTTPISPII